MKNVIFLVVDCLSREYTENYPVRSGNFFRYLDDHAICADNMYSTAPFTEGGLQGLWNATSPLETFWGNRLHPDCQASIFSIFQKAGYEVCFTDRTSVEMYAGDYQEPEYAKIKRIISDRIGKLVPDIKYYLEKENTHIPPGDAVRNILDMLFRDVERLREEDYPLLVKEMQSYYGGRDAYIQDGLLKLKERHSLFQALETAAQAKEKKEHECPVLEEELLLAQNIAYKNGELLKKYNKHIPNADFLINQNLNGMIYNRCVQSNLSILNSMRMDSAVIKDSPVHRYIISSGIYQFIEEKRKKMKAPYFAYFHEFSFHYPETFLNACKDEKKYKAELEKCIKRLPELHPENYSVLKALSLIFVSEGLAELVKYLESKGVFEDTYLVITADHGISNFMYPLDRNYRWMFYKENFHVPFWILGADIKPERYDSLCLSRCVVPTLAELCGIKSIDTKESLFHAKREYVLTEWMNGIPDIEKEYVKFGYRNEKISLTYCVRLNQLFQSGRILALFDLEKDSREYYDLSRCHLNEEIRMEVDKAKDIIYKRWDRLRKKYLNIKYTAMLDQMEQNMEISPLMKENMDIILGRDVALFGTDSVSDTFLQRWGCRVSVREIIDTTNQDLYYNGRPICRDINGKANKNNIIYVIACEDEIDALFHLYRWGVEKVYVYTGKP